MAGDRYFEDYPIGSIHDLRQVPITQDEILHFARQFDPQPFHTDPQAAQDSPFGGLIASGLHTLALMMRQIADHFLSPASSMGSPGLDQVRWLAPVRPDDQLHVTAHVLDARPSGSKPDRGIVTAQFTVSNQQAVPVMTVQAAILMRRRPA